MRLLPDAPRPILSIITPSFNQAPYLRQTLESVAEQPVPPGSVEHIVIDGGSTDGSVDIIREFEGRLASWVSEPDRGQSEAINKGLARARGTFATWINSDDWYEPGVLAEVVRRLSGSEDALDVLVGRCKFIAEGGRVVFDPRPPEPISAANLLRLTSQWFRGRLIVQPEAFFRLEPVRRLGGVNVENHYSMDHELWVRLALGGAVFRTFDRHVANLRVHAAQKTASNREVVRCLLRFARPLAEQNLKALGADAPAVMAEIDRMSAKLAAADPLYERWKPEQTACRAEGAPGGLWGSAAVYLDSIADEEETRNGQRRGLHGPRVQVGLAALPRNGGLVRPWRVLVVAADGGQAALRVLDRFRRRRIDLSAWTIAPSQRGAMTARLGLDGSGAGRRGVLQRIRGLPAGESGLESAILAGPYDLVLAETVLMHCARPQEVLERLWRCVRIGGYLLSAGEPGDRATIEAHLNELCARMSRQISAHDDVLLSHMADHFLGRVELGRVEAERGDGLASWAAAHPGARGMEIRSWGDSLAGARLVLERRYGAMDFQPIAPFPTVEGVPAPGDGWAMLLWRKEEPGRD